MRKFYITNGKNNVKYLTVPSSKIFMNDPKGLGYSQTLSTDQYGNKINAQADTNFGTIDGEIVFLNDTMSGKYDKYNSFVDFLSYKPLVLSYTIPTSPAQTFTIDVEVLSLDKTEIDSGNSLRCAVSFQCLSRWKGNSFFQMGTTSVSLANNGHFPVGFTITINGTNMENPYFTLEQNSELYGEGKFLGTFSKVTVNSEDGNQNVELQQNGSVLPNPLGYQDLSISNGSIYVTFVKLARGTSTWTVGVDSGTVTNYFVNYTPLYRSV